MNYAMTRLPLLSGSGEVGIDSRFFDTEKYHPERIRGIYNALFTSESGAAAGRGNIMQSLSQFWRLRQ